MIQTRQPVRPAGSFFMGKLPETQLTSRLVACIIYIRKMLLCTCCVLPETGSRRYIMELWYFQKGFNYSQDGPGNRLVYHLCACNMRCPWCSNPEGMKRYEDKAQHMPVESVAKAVISAKPMYFENGGLTLTGGEATMQFDAVKELFTRVKAAGVNTCIETNASHPRFTELFPLLDTLIADFKNPDDEAHHRWTGISNVQIKENLRAAAAYGIPMQLRVPLIHGVNDDEASMTGFRDFFSEINRPGMTVEFLRYHEYGKEKWKKLGLEYKMENAFVTEKCAQAFENTCREAGICVVRT